MNKSNKNFKEKSKLATRKSTKHSNFDQTKQKGIAFIERMNMEMTTFYAEIRIRTSFFAKEQDWPQYANRVFLIMERKPLHKIKLNKSNINFKEHTNLATKKLTMHSNFDQTKKTEVILRRK